MNHNSIRSQLFSEIVKEKAERKTAELEFKKTESEMIASNKPRLSKRKTLMRRKESSVQKMGLDCIADADKQKTSSQTSDASLDKPEDAGTKKRRRQPPKPKLSFNQAVTVFNYNKYNAQLASPPPANEGSDGKADNEDSWGSNKLKVAKKRFGRKQQN